RLWFAHETAVSSIRQVDGERPSTGSTDLDFRLVFAYDHGRSDEIRRRGTETGGAPSGECQGMFTHLHVHSNFSMGRGADRLETLVVAAARRGYDTLALTDTNGLYGMVWYLTAAREAGLRPIIGAQALYRHESAVVLVRDAAGYAGLCRL